MVIAAAEAPRTKKAKCRLKCCSTRGGNTQIKSGRVDAAQPPPTQSYSVDSENATASVTGTEVDHARCVIVALRLPNNNMVMEGNQTQGLGEGLGSINSLAELILTDNELRGPIPAYFSATRWQRLKLVGNRFLYAERGGDENVPAPSTQALVQHCRQRNVRCEGVPPISCAAFRPESGRGFYVVETLNPDRCYLCDLDPSSSVVMIVGVAFLAIFFCALYAYLLLRHGEMLRSGVASFTIVYAHMKTFMSSRIYA